MPTFLVYQDPSTYSDRDLATMVSRLLSPRPEAIRLRKPTCYPDSPDEYPVWRTAMLEEYNRRFTPPGASPPIQLERS